MSGNYTSKQSRRAEGDTMKTATTTRNTLDGESRALLGQMRKDKRIRVLEALQAGNIEAAQRAVGRYRKAEYVNGSIQISQKYY